MSADTKGSRRIPAPLALIFAANAATQFAIQAWLAYGFAKEVWRLVSPLPYFVPVALDVFAINLMAAAYQLRAAKFRQRAYVWILLGFVIGAQIGASEGFADHEDWNHWGRVASVVPAIFLAGSLHVLIMVARKRDHAAATEAGPGRFARWRSGIAISRAIRAERKAVSKTPQVVKILPRVIQSTTAEMAAGAAPVRIETERPIEPPAPPPLPSGKTPRPAVKPRAISAAPRPAGRREHPLKADLIKRVIVGGEPAATVAKEMDIDPRTAQLWVKAARAATPGDPSAHAGDQ
jgi:hypothetical protein